MTIKGVTKKKDSEFTVFLKGDPFLHLVGMVTTEVQDLPLYRDGDEAHRSNDGRKEGTRRGLFPD